MTWATSRYESKERAGIFLRPFGKRRSQASADRQKWRCRRSALPLIMTLLINTPSAIPQVLIIHSILWTSRPPIPHRDLIPSVSLQVTHL